MARCVLISPPFVTDYMRNARCDFVSLSSSSWYPIWLGQAGSYLEGCGHQTRLFDAQVLGWSRARALDEIASFGADVVAVYTGRLSEDSDVAFADDVARTGRTVVLVGPYASIDPEAILRKCSQTELAIQQEFDLPLEEVCAGDDPTTIPNMWIKRDADELTHTGSRPLLKKKALDEFPITSEYFHRQLNIQEYKTPSELYPFIDVMSGRGCAWGKCNFCLWVQTFVPGSVYNLRSIEHFMEEFEYVRRYMPELQSVMIQDDMLTNKRAREISEGLLERNHTIRWSCYAKPNSQVTQDTLNLMRRSGCLNLHVGFESGDDEVLKNIDKGTTVAQAKEFATMVHAADLQLHGDFAMGHLGDTKESMQRTLDLAKAIDPHTAQFQIMIPFKGTRFWRQIDERNAWTQDMEPSYEASGGANSEEIRASAKAAYRSFYLSRSYIKKIVTQPREYFFNRFDQYAQAIPAVFWRRWVK